LFKKILAPVDLLHLDKLDRALAVTADEARRHSAIVTYVSVTIAGPSRVARGPDEFRAKLERFVANQVSLHGLDGRAHVAFSNDPTTDVDDALLKAVREIEADLVIMASHKPGFVDFFWPSNGGKIATHSDASIFLVRDT